MKRRYTVKRGKRSCCEYDVLVYDNNKPDSALVFTGRFGASGNRRLNGDELKIIATIKQALEDMA